MGILLAIRHAFLIDWKEPTKYYLHCQLFSMNLGSIGYEPCVRFLNKLRCFRCVFFGFFNCTFAKWMHNPRQCNKASIEKTLFVAVFVWQVLNCNQKKKRKEPPRSFISLQSILSVFLFFVSIFSAKCSVVLVACFSNPSLSHVHMVCEAQYQLFVLSWLVCIFTF